ncbi:TPA: hypothetical protein ACGOVD_000011 [Streptococcus suis]
MFTSLINTIKRYPEQALLFLYNAGVFAWLQTSGKAILEQVGLDSNWLEKIPEPVRELTGASVAGLQGILQSSAWGWLIVSMMLMVVIRFVKGVIKFILMLLILVGGAWLIWQNKELLNGLV